MQNTILIKLTLIALFYAAAADSAYATALLCTGNQLTPNAARSSEYINRCFLLNIELALDFDTQHFSLNGEYGPKTCGGWPPFFQSDSGEFRAEEDGGIYLLDSSKREVRLTVFGSAALFEGPLGSYKLHCTSAN